MTEHEQRASAMLGGIAVTVHPANEDGKSMLSSTITLTNGVSFSASSVEDLIDRGTPRLAMWWKHALIDLIDGIDPDFVQTMGVMREEIASRQAA